MESLDCYITTIWAYCKKGGHHRKQAFRLDVNKEYCHKNMFSEWVDLVYNISKGFSGEILIKIRQRNFTIEDQVKKK